MTCCTSSFFEVLVTDDLRSEGGGDPWSLKVAEEGGECWVDECWVDEWLLEES